MSQKPVETILWHVSVARHMGEPLMPSPLHLVTEAIERIPVAGDPIIRIMSM